MKSLITMVVLGMFGVAMAGCEASGRAEIGDDDDDTRVRKTTEVDRSGDRSVKTETTIRRD